MRGHLMKARPLDGLATAWEGQLAHLSRLLSYVLLVASTLLAVLQAPFSWANMLGTLALVGLVGAWLEWFVVLRSTRRGVIGLFYVGLLAGIAVLLTRSPWFGMLVIPSFDLAFTRLARGWVLLGVVATSALAATSLRGGIPAGIPQPTFADVTSFVLTVAVYAVLGGGFTFIGQRTQDQNQKRKHLVAELAEANQRLELTLQENAGLHAQLLIQAREAGIVDERQRLAREIHDTLAQGFIGIIAQLEVTKQSSQPSMDWHRHVEQAQHLARESLREARRSVQALRPEPLERAQLPDAITDLAGRWAQTNTINVTVEITGEPRPLLPEIEVTLFRVAQEALANVAKHARASRVGVTLSYCEDVVLLDVRDDGIGFTAESGFAAGQAGDGQGFGLTAMQQRVRQVAGTIEIESAPGAGTAINATVPALSVGGPA